MNELLPNLIIAGVSKGGSTALAGYLGQHRDICQARSQEVYYALARGAPEPEMLPYLRGFRHYRGERYLCEHGATYYFGGSQIIDAIQENTPDARILMTVRDPVERLWSAYNYKKSKFRLSRDSTFEDFVSESERRHNAGVDTVPDPVWRELEIGFYERTIVPWLEAFADRIRVLFFEQWTRNPVPALGELCEWLALDAEPVRYFDYSTRNRTVLHRNRLVKESAYAMNRSASLVLVRTPRLKERLRRVYYAANADRVSEQIRPETRQRVSDIYRASNTALARALRADGYKRLPEWLEDLPS